MLASLPSASAVTSSNRFPLGDRGPVSAPEPEPLDVPPNAPVVARLKGAGRALAGLVFVTGALVAFGWTFHVEALTTLVPGLSPMKPNTAIAFVLAGIALGLRCKPLNVRWKVLLTTVCSAGVTALGLVTLLEFVAHADFGIDRLLFVEAVRTAPSSRMSLSSAIGFTVLGPALLNLGARRKPRVWMTQTLALGLMALGSLALLGYLYGASSLFSAGPFGSVALHTAVAFVLTAFSLLLSQADLGWMRFLTAETVASTSARRMLPAIAAIPVAIGWLRLLGQRSGLYTTEIGVGILTLSNVFLIAGYKIWRTRSTVRSELAQRKLHAALVQNAERARSDKSFRTIAERTIVGMFIHRDGALVYANEELARTLGYGSPAEMVHCRVLTTLIHPADSARVADRIRNVLTLGRAEVATVRFLRKDGSTAFLETAGVLLEFEGAPSILVTARDVTIEHAAYLARKQAEQALRVSLAEKEVLLKEVHHRVKNNLQVVASLIRLESDRALERGAARSLGDLQSRVRAIALIHERLYRAKDLAHIEMDDYVSSLVAEVVRANCDERRPVKVHVEAPSVFLNVDQAVPVGLLVNELLTNAFKHAFSLDFGRDNEIQVRLVLAAQNFELTVSDNGVGLPERFIMGRNDSLGMSLIAGLSRQLDGAFVFERHGGTQFRLTFPQAVHRSLAPPATFAGDSHA